MSAIRRVVRVLYALSGYLGDGSERLTCAQMVPIFGYYFKGGHYPAGGSGRFADVLAEAIEERGGQVHLKSPVRRILVENGRAAGVILANGRTVGSKAVVSNADMKRTFLELVGPETCRVPFASRSPPRRLPTRLSACISAWISCRTSGPHVHLDTPMRLGIAAMSKLDPSAAPAGHSTLMLIRWCRMKRRSRWFPEGEEGDWKAWRRSAGI